VTSNKDPVWLVKWEGEINARDAESAVEGILLAMEEARELSFSVQRRDGVGQAVTVVHRPKPEET